MKEKILCVDDDPNILAAYQRSLRKTYTIDTCLGGEEALKQMAAQGPYAVIVADMQMPRMNGIEFLKKAREQAPDSVRIMLTGNADQTTAIEAVNQGAIFRFLTKPCPPEIFALVLAAGLRQYQLITAERELLERTLSGSVKMLTDILSIQDPQTFGRSMMVRDYLRYFGKPHQTIESWQLDVAAMLFQIGMVTIPPNLLQKVRAGFELTETERDVMSRVPEISANILANIPRLEPVAEIVRYQGKHFDGSGIPVDSVSGDQIPIGSRILKVLADMVDLESGGMSRTTALSHMQSQSGWYDPWVMESAIAHFETDQPEAALIPKSSREVRVRDLQPGQNLRSNVETVEGMLIIPAGNRISAAVLEKIRNFARLGDIKEPILIED